MDDNGPAGMILFFVLLLISMLFHGFSAAISNLNDAEIQKDSLIENRKKRRALRLIAIKNAPMRYSITAQIAISLVYIVLGGYYLELWITNITVFFTGNPTVDTALESLLFVTALLLMVSIFLTFGVLVPKKIATKYARQIAYGFITPVYFVTQITMPLTWLISITSKSILLIFGIKNNEEYSDVTEEEIISMVNEGHEQGVLEASEAEMITNIFEFGDKEATDIMTHRKNIVAIENTMVLKEAIDYMLEEKYSRYPVYNDTIDQIIGILYLKDSLRIYSDSNYLDTPIKDIEGLIREAQFIPETKNIDDLFKNMQSLKIQMTIIIDEYGQTSGLVTMEDILEEIVGNIMDEYDEEENSVDQMSEDQYVVEGKIKLEELEELLDITFAEGDFETLNGYIISKLEKIPEENEEFEIDCEGYNFKILTVSNKMIQTVLVTKIKTDETELEPIAVESVQK